jgi:DNA (cytosine-5)-methyltransferase 1
MNDSQSKPPYRVPSMMEIAAIPWNGFTAASTFSGCGGSSLGYRMAGFRILYANEFIPAAQDSYRANAADYTFLDTRDIRTVQPHDILEKIGLAPGELDLFDGSPPCASFSTAGKREAGWGKVKKYSDSEQRTDDLFFEFARLLRGLQPKTFVAENVSGLVKGTAKGYFLEILRELKSCGYKVGCKVLDAQWLGVPQARQRTIFVGVRNDLPAEPAHPKPLPYRYSVRDALPWIYKVKIGPLQTDWKDSSDRPSHTIIAGGERPSENAYTARATFVEAETDISRYAIGAEWERMKKPGTQSEKYFQLQRPSLNEPCPTITLGAGALSCAGVVHPTEKRRFSIAELKRICAFPDDFKLTGTYAQQWERCGRSVPPVMMSHIAATIRDEILRKL